MFFDYLSLAVAALTLVFGTYIASCIATTESMYAAVFFLIVAIAVVCFLLKDPKNKAIGAAFNLILFCLAWW